MNNMMVTLSIIIPVYNGQDTIEKCIYSILHQVSADTEIIIVDDGSTDKTKDICSDICSLDSRMKLVSKENGGVSSARNKGIEVSSGKYIMFVDCDDIIPNLFFDSFLQMIPQLDNKVLVLSRIATHYLGNNIVIVEGANIESDKEFSLDKIVDIWDEHLWNSPVNKIYIRKILEDNNIRFELDINIGEDWLFNNAYVRAFRPQSLYIIGNPAYDYYLDSNPWRHSEKEEFYEINKKQVDDFKLTLIELNISSSEIDKFDKRDLDFTISEIRRVARDSKITNSERISKISFLINRENVKNRIISHSKLYSYLDRAEFAIGSATFVFLWENIRKKIGIIRNGGSFD